MGSITASVAGGAMIRDNVGGVGLFLCCSANFSHSLISQAMAGDGSSTWAPSCSELLVPVRFCFDRINNSPDLELGIAIFYRPIRHPELHEKPYLQRLMALDWVGTFLFSAGMVPFIVGLLIGGNRYPWKSAAPIACLVVGAVFFVIFGLHQAFVRKDGVFNHRLFKHRNFAIALLTIFVEGIVYITLNVSV
jgi:hypothetical protein